MENITKINWYPGHMKKARELIESHLKQVDLVLEVCDARIPISSRNPIISEILKSKKKLLILNKSDLADSFQNQAWKNFFAKKNIQALLLNSVSGEGLKELYRELDKIAKGKKVTKGPLRMMIVGIPNSGKSSLINRLTKKKSAQIGNRPGVTRGKQWLTLENGMQVLDTPGILWHKFDDPQVGLNLAFCGSIKDEILDVTELAFELIKYLRADYGDLIIDRYKIDSLGNDPLDTMEKIAIKRGCILPGKKIDYQRTGQIILDEFRSGKIGRVSLEKSPK